MPHRCIVMGAAGRDFHDFLTFFRAHPDFHVECFTAAQIPFIEQRAFPRSLAGPGYLSDIPIRPERELPALIAQHRADFVFLAYSDLAHDQVMHAASVAQAAWASFVLLGPSHTQLASKRPVIAVLGVRTGVGKSPLTLWLAKQLGGVGLRPAVLRHPMPYGALEAQRVQRFDGEAALTQHRCTIEEREEYEPYVEAGLTVWAGVDYEAILRVAEREADVVLWDGGNNDFSFLEADLTITVVDALRPGHERRFYPGETNLRRADVVVLNKASMATRAALDEVRGSVAALNPRALVVESDLEVTLEPADAAKGRRVLVVEDGPTLTHGGMAFGAGVVAAQRGQARELIDPRPFAVGSIAEAFRAHPHLGAVLPALGYSEGQRRELEETMRRASPEVIIDASPARLDRFLTLPAPTARARYAWVQTRGAPLLEVARAAIERARARLADPPERDLERAKAIMRQADTWGARTYEPLPVVLTRGEGPFVWDVDGVKYLDGLSGYSALNQGHCHPHIVAALAAQADRLTLTSRAFHNDVMGRLLERLGALTGYPKVVLMNSGVEAVETALKAMRRWGEEAKGVPEGAGEIIVADGNFHGRTITAVSLSTEPSAFAHYGPFTPGFVKVPFGDAEALARALTPRTVGVLLEPIQGEAGVIIPPDGYLPAVREACHRARVVLALDEVQTGLGRTGRLFAWQHSGARPDLLVLGKALSGGVYPVSAVCGSAEVMNVFTPGTHGSTFGGNPLGCAAALAALEVLLDEHLTERAAGLGEQALGRLRQGLEGARRVKAVRGRGLMLAVERAEADAHDVAVRLAQEAHVLCKDTRGRVLRVLPPLVTPETVLLDALERMIPVLRG
jgi:ornithine aminotransferase